MLSSGYILTGTLTSTLQIQQLVYNQVLRHFLLHAVGH